MMKNPVTTSLMEHRRKELARLGPMAPQFSFGFNKKRSSSDYFRTLPFRRVWIAIAIAGGFLLAFSLPLVSVGSDFFDVRDGSLFDLVFFLFTAFWMLGWSVGVAVLALVFLALLTGRETVAVANNKLTLRIGLPGIGLGATYDGSLIRHFRSANRETDSGNSWRGEHLVFDYAGEPVHFGSGIAGESARVILQELAALFPRHQSPLPELPALTTETEAEASQSVPDQAARISRATTATLQTTDTAVSLTSVSTLALIAANLIPLAGVLLYGWSIGEIMLLFWAESAIIGYYNLCKMWKIGRWSLLFYGPFFTGHYGAFMVGHLLFIYGFFATEISGSADVSVSDVFSDFITLWPALLGLTISHGISYYVNFLGRQEYRNKDISKQMGEPYKRIVIMHVTIIFGGFLALMFGTPLPALMLLIVLKVAADVVAHLREHAAPTQT